MLMELLAAAASLVSPPRPLLPPSFCTAAFSTIQVDFGDFFTSILKQRENGAMGEGQMLAFILKRWSMRRIFMLANNLRFLCFLYV